MDSVISVNDNKDVVSQNNNNHEEEKLEGKEKGDQTVNQGSISRVPDLIPADNRINNNNNQESGEDVMDAKACFGGGSSKGSQSNSSGRRSPRLSVRGDAPDYCMTHARRGRCVIINNKNFDPRTQLNERKGTEKDAEALTDCFSNFNFDVERIEDGSVFEIRSRLKELSRQDFSHDDCLVVCVLTHGDRGVLWGRDNRYSVEDLYSSFTGDKCKSLVGKPKIFLIQACQGSKFDRGEFIGKCTDEIDAGSYFKIPVWADFLIMYSTIPGYYSWRNPKDGSWFVQALVSVLNKYHTDMDLLSMLTLVNRKVAYEFESFCPGQGDFDGNKQVPCITSMLTRRLYFSSNAAV